MRQVILMRHAKSDWKKGVQTDFERPLNKRGKRDAPRVGEWMCEEGIRIDQVLCSSAKRTRETCELWQSGYGQDPAIQFLDELYRASPETIAHQVRGLDESVRTVLIIAHNPGMQLLTQMLSGLSRSFPTAACAGFRYDGLDSWSDWPGDETAEEMFFQIPKELGG